ncbi:MAG: nitroreductase family protein [Defluviitaleaceae bacterium]|nr:nitroreductase family protein [Defluviitaleaceae bacterium]
MGNPVLEAIADRRSNRGYKSEQISKEQLDALLLAAAQSPSARNSQPWHFTVVQNQELIKEVNDEANSILGRTDGIFYGAPTVIFISCDNSAKWGRLDSGIAVQTIALAAHSLGLGSVILGLPDAAFTGPRGEYFKQLLKFPDKKDFAVAIAVGIPTVTKEAHPIEPDLVTYIE